MECYCHKKIAVANCSNCYAALCEDCMQRFPGILCYGCAEMRRRELAEKNDKFKIFLIFSIPIGLVIGLMLQMLIHPNNTGEFIIGTLCGGMFPCVLRRIFIIRSGYWSTTIVYGGIFFGLIRLVLYIMAFGLAYYFSWIVFVPEIIVFISRKNEIEILSSRL